MSSAVLPCKMRSESVGIGDVGTNSFIGVVVVKCLMGRVSG